MKTNWTFRQESPKLRDKLVKSLKISPITARVLVNRGIRNEEEANLFLNSTLFDLPSPNLMEGMDKAINRVKEAIKKDEKVAIYGDYDVDGITSTTLLYKFLSDLGVDVIYYNPHRIKEGYGVNIAAVEGLASKGVKLIISGDCGITAVKEVERAKELGVDFIVTDHHKPPDDLPKGVSILNPQLSGCKYPGKEITGVGVVFNLTIGLRRALRDSGFFKNEEPNLADYLDLVALGTVADCAPLINVNRIFVKEGIKRMRDPKRKGVRALKELSAIKGEVSSFDLGFKLGPRVNASGRISSAEKAVKMLLSEDLEDARQLARTLNEDNVKRRSVETSILSEAVSQVESNPEYSNSASLVLASSDWHPGIIGIVASRIVERFDKPTVLVAIGADGVGKGSARSVSGINIYEVLSECSELLEQFGGHELAAGISIRMENIDKLRERINNVISGYKRDSEAGLAIDCHVDLNSMTAELVTELEMLAPFGIGNPEPVLMARSVEVVSQRFFKDKHLRFRVRQGDKLNEAIWFNAFVKSHEAAKEPAQWQPQGTIRLPDKIDLAFTPEFNEWNGNREIRFRVKDVNTEPSLE